MRARSNAKLILAVATMALAVLAMGMPDRKALAGPTVLFEAGSAKVLYAEDADDQWHPASLTKIMTAYLVFEALKGGRIKLDTKFAYSATAHQQPPSKIGLPIGYEVPIDLALQSIIIKSANDIAVTIAEGLSGSVDAFAALMNAKAKQLGMTRTRFMNPNGLPDPKQVTTARDMARLARAVVRDFPEYARYWSMKEMQFGRQRIRTHNDVLKTYEGADGLKTGYICDSKFNLVASATRNGTRMIAVLLGEPSPGERRIRAEALLEHGFNSLGWKLFFSTTTLETLATSPQAKSVKELRSSKLVADCKRKRRVARISAARRKARREALVKKRKEAAARKKARSNKATSKKAGSNKTAAGKSSGAAAKQ